MNGNDPDMNSITAAKTDVERKQYLLALAARMDPAPATPPDEDPYVKRIDAIAAASDRLKELTGAIKAYGPVPELLDMLNILRENFESLCDELDPITEQWAQAIRAEIEAMTECHAGAAV